MVDDGRGGLLRALGRDLLGLVLPVCCAGCGLPDEPWCAACARHLAAPAWRCEDRAGRLDRLDGVAPAPVWAVADFVGPVRHAVSAWKDRGRHDLTGVLAAAARRCAGEVADGVRRDAAATGGRVAPLLVVPAPSTAAAIRRRGGEPVAALADAVAAELVRRGVPARACRPLRRRGGADQSGLSARARARNVAGRVRVPARRGALLAGALVVLVDDVLTTGATFAACDRALAAAGARVVAGVVVASTPGPRSAARAGGEGAATALAWCPEPVVRRPSPGST